jgi:hypothetical protein
MGTALPRLGLPSRADFYARALEGLVQVNGLVLDNDPSIPPVYYSGARWRNIPHSNWRRADQIAGDGWGDCEGLSAWRVAELRRTGEDPYARVGCYHTGPKRYHAIVIRGNDAIEDPSIALGMVPPVNRHIPQTRGEMNVINGMWPTSVTCGHGIIIGDFDGSGEMTKFVDLPDGTTVAQVQLPLADASGAIIATSKAVADKAEAAAQAATMLKDMAQTIGRNPAMIAKLNPYAAAALMLYQIPAVQSSVSTFVNKGKNLLKKIF